MTVLSQDGVSRARRATSAFFFKPKTACEMRISDWSSDVCSSDLLPRHALEIIDRRSHPLPPFGALAGVLLDPLDQGGRLLRDPIGPGLPHRIEQDAIIRAGTGRGRRVELSGVERFSHRRGRPIS